MPSRIVRLAPPFLKGPPMAGDEPGADLSVGDRIIVSLLFNTGWPLILIGLEPIGQDLITGHQVISYSAAAAIIIAGAVFLTSSYLWPPSKPETRELFAKFLSPIAARSKSIAVGAVLALCAITLFQVLAVRRDLDNYVMPRTLTSEQMSALRSFFAHEAVPPYRITIVVDRTDDEATHFAGDLNSALQSAGWQVKFYGPDDLPIPAQTLPPGLCTFTVGQDLKIAEAQQILVKSLQEANVFEVTNCGPPPVPYRISPALFLVVGKRPVSIVHARQPLLSKLGFWLMRHAGF